MREHWTWWVKIQVTALTTRIQSTCTDGPVKLDVHCTNAGKLVGYCLRAQKEPLIQQGTQHVGLFFRELPGAGETKPLDLNVPYHDQYIRLLSFSGGHDDSKDYLLVLRNRQVAGTT